MLAAECTGYACPPEGGVPAGEVIVKTITKLADTGIDSVWFYVAVFAACFLISFGITFTWGRR